jgi:hypothetical protein
MLENIRMDIDEVIYDKQFKNTEVLEMILFQMIDEFSDRKIGHLSAAESWSMIR